MKNDMITEKQDLPFDMGKAGTRPEQPVVSESIFRPWRSQNLLCSLTMTALWHHRARCVNELIVDRLSLLGVEHLHYQLLHADILLDDQPTETWLCSSDDFKQPGETKIALDAYYQAERMVGESPLDFCIRNGWASYVYEMLVVDYLILNRDRHGANMEVLRNGKARTVRLAPLFDHGLSLCFPAVRPAITGSRHHGRQAGPVLCRKPFCPGEPRTDPSRKRTKPPPPSAF